MTEPNSEPAVAAPRSARLAKRRRWPWLFGIVAAFILGILIGSSSSGGTPAPAAAGGIPPGTVTVTASAPAPAPPPSPAPPPGPKTEFGDGTYLVGTDIAAGSYKSSGPRPGGVGMCYWARMKDDSGQNIIANSAGQGPTRVTVNKGEYLQVTGCDFTEARQ